MWMFVDSKVFFYKQDHSPELRKYSSELNPFSSSGHQMTIFDLRKGRKRKSLQGRTMSSCSGHLRAVTLLPKTISVPKHPPGVNPPLLVVLNSLYPHSIRVSHISIFSHAGTVICSGHLNADPPPFSILSRISMGATYYAFCGLANAIMPLCVAVSASVSLFGGSLLRKSSGSSHPCVNDAVAVAPT